MVLTWMAVRKRWLPLIKEMERLGFDDYAEPEIYRAAEAEILALVAENRRLREVLEYIVECYLGDDETGYVAANMYEAAKAALAQEGGGRHEDDE